MYPSMLMIKPASAECNLHCSYCFYHRPWDPYRQDKARRMSLETLETIVRKQFQAADSAPLSFMFQGGEPLLAGRNFFAHAGQLVNRYRSPGQPVTLALQTNGVLIDGRMAHTLAEHNYLVGVSLDGPAHLHNIYRRKHQSVLRGIRTLQVHNLQPNILTVVSAANVNHARQVYQYLKDEIGARHLQFIPCVELRDGRPIPESVAPEEYTQFLLALFHAWRRDGYGSVSIRLFDSITNRLYNGRSGSCTLEPTCARSLVVEHNGEAYPCDFYVAQEQRLGSYTTHSPPELMASAARVRLEQEKGQWPPVCDDCPYLALCHGGCPKYRRINLALHGRYHSYFCPAYRALFEQLVPVSSQFVAQVMWREALPLERTLLFGLAELGQDGTTLPAIQQWLAECEQDVHPDQVRDALSALKARQVLIQAAGQVAFRNTVLPDWIKHHVLQK